MSRPSRLHARRGLLASTLAVAMLLPVSAVFAAPPPRSEAAAQLDFREVGSVSLPSRDKFAKLPVEATIPVGIDPGIGGGSLIALDKDYRSDAAYVVDTRALTLTRTVRANFPPTFTYGSQALDPMTHTLYVGRACPGGCDYGQAASLDPTGTAKSVSPPWPSMKARTMRPPR